MNHLQLPLRSIYHSDLRYAHVRDTSGLLFAIYDQPNIEKEIVHACNAYPALLAACKAHNAVGDHVQVCPRCGDSRDCQEYNALWNKADALAQAAVVQAENADV